MRRPRLVAVASMRDEEWILERWIQRISEFVDGIVIVDDGSTDDTPRILKASPKVLQVFRNEPGGMGPTRHDRNRMLEAAREHGAEWVMIIDADEIMDARLGDRLDDLLCDEDVGRIYFKEVTLWRSNEFYRVDKPEMYARDTGTNQILRLSPALRWALPAQFTLHRRVFSTLRTRRFLPAPVAGNESIAGIWGETLRVTDLVRIHYHFADWERAWRLHVRYAARDAIQFRRRPRELHDVVRWATHRLDEEGLELAPVKPEWGVL